ncbi:MAG TPA: site-specific DNA-methyltransferase [Gaiellaceae bacterium]|jgi:site-specific DNA-methyltransferase (adenine-specific)|nr:site-specific DNA-methyltransferase [Gaiellaceae bacterium]
MLLHADEIYEGDARDLLPLVAPDSVALALWSPPYHVGKAYEEGVTVAEWEGLLREVIALHEPILKPGGFLVININDILAFPDPEMPRIQADNVSHRRQQVTREQIEQAIAAHPDANRRQLAALLGCSEQTIDRRLNGNNARGGKYQPQTRVKLAGPLLEEAAMEAGLYLHDRRVWLKDPAWVNSRWTSSSYRSVDDFEYLYVFWKAGVTKVDRGRLAHQEWGAWGSRGVWTIPSVRANDEHEAMFPSELPRRCIRLLTEPGELVLDCFAGSGTTAAVARELGRRYIAFELDPAYAQLARRRLLLARSGRG